MKRFLGVLLVSVFLLNRTLFADEISNLVKTLKEENKQVAQLRKEEQTLAKQVLSAKRLESKLVRLEQVSLQAHTIAEQAVNNYQTQRLQLKDAIEKDTKSLNEYKNWVASLLQRALSPGLTQIGLNDLMKELTKQQQNNTVCGHNVTFDLFLKAKAQVSAAKTATTSYRAQLEGVADLPAEYSGLLEAAKAQADELEKTTQVLSDDINSLRPAIELPRLCRWMDTVARLIALRGVMLEAAATGEDLSIIQFNIDTVLKKIDSEQVAIAYAGAVKRSILAMSSRFFLHLNNLQASEAAMIADNVVNAASLLMDNVRSSKKLSPTAVSEMETAVKLTITEILEATKLRLADKKAFRQLVLLRAKRLQSRIFTIDQSNLTGFQRMAWNALKQSLQSNLGFPEQGVFRLPNFSLRQELVDFDGKLAAAEEQISAAGLES